MVSYYNSLAMFPHQTSRAGPPSAGSGNPATSLYHGYGHHAAYNNYPPPAGATADQNSNLQLYGMSQFDFSQAASAAAVTPSAWTAAGHASAWGSHFPPPASCRSAYDWENASSTATPTSTTILPPPSPEITPTSASGLNTSPGSPNGGGPPPFIADGGRSPGAPASFHEASTPSSQQQQYNAPPTPPQYKLEPPSSSSELGLAPPPPAGSMGSDLHDDCPSPSSLPPSRPGPARSPYEWMKKPAYQSPTSLNDPNGKYCCYFMFSFLMNPNVLSVIIF